MTRLRKRGTAPKLPNPYKPGSPGYAERHRAHKAEVREGAVRVDVGEPAGLLRDTLGLKHNDKPKRQGR